ncbi:helix-turn-helix domain-containing protein [Clostridioides difficile]
MRKTKETHTFDFRPLGLAIREARERAGLSRNDLGDKVFYGERHIADIENVGSHPSFQLFHDLVTMFNISVDEYFYPPEKVDKSTARRQIETALDLLSDNELKIIQGTIDGILNSRESKK